MDFVKSCATNTYIVEHILQTRFHLYRWDSSDLDEAALWSQSHEILTRLRSYDIICARSGNELWIFTTSDHEEIITNEIDVDQSLVAVGQGVLESAPDKETAGGKALIDVLFDGIERALAFKLAQEVEYMWIRPWTWVYVEADREEGVSAGQLMIRMHRQLTAHGALVLVPEVTPTTLTPPLSAADTLDTVVWLSPYGRLAKVKSIAKMSPSEDTWKHYVRQALRSEAIDIKLETPWLYVQLIDGLRENHILWPATLCLHSDSAGATDHTISFEDETWRRWFTTANADLAYRDPFAAAEQWFQEYHSIKQKAKDIKEFSPSDDQFLEHASNVSGVAASGAHPLTSPSFSQRSIDQQGFLLGVYPTPPEGLAPIHVSASSQMSAEAASQTPQAEGPGQMGDLFTESQVPAPQRHVLDRSVSGEGGHEDLFGDAGGLDFNENEIGDADFSFFDEPDEEQMGMFGDTLVITNIPQIDSDIDMTASMGMYQNDNPLRTSALDVSAAEHNAALSRRNTPSPTHDDEPLPVEAEVPDDTMSESEIDLRVLPPPQKPLSPFGIRERILPPPIPASIAQVGPRLSGEQSSGTFSPVTFREGFNLAYKYAASNFAHANTPEKAFPNPNINLPATHRQPRRVKHYHGSGEQSSDEGSESEERSPDYFSSESDDDLPPKLPWDTRKRKRHEQDAAYHLAGTLEHTWSEKEGLTTAIGRLTPGEMLAFLGDMLNGISHNAPLSKSQEMDGQMDILKRSHTRTAELRSIEHLYELSKQDLIFVAQVISEQSASTLFSNAAEVDSTVVASPNSTAATTRECIRHSLATSITSIYPDANLCDLNKIVLSREAPSRTVTVPGKAVTGQPRPLQRSDSFVLGPDVFNVPAPYVRIQRNNDDWEMLPTGLSFWESLGLAPANGPKNIRAYCVCPANRDLQNVAERFMANLGTVYENCKLGSHVHRHEAHVDDGIGYKNGIVPVELGEDHTTEAALRRHAEVCKDLGRRLASIDHSDKDRTIAIYILDPFAISGVAQHLSACFWMLFNAYRDHLPKAQKSGCGSDMILQIIPISLIASFDGLAIPDSPLMAALAREVYDRCPPTSSRPTEGTSMLPIDAAPSVELAGPTPKRIGFQLTAEPPSDLLHEGSVLHLAYSRSQDGQWITAAWVDSTGRYRATTAFCLRGRSLLDTVGDIWTRTREILNARQVTWRVFVTTDEPCEQPIVQLWRSLVVQPRVQPLCVTFSSIRVRPILQLTSMSLPGDPFSISNVQDGGFPTPASTPQGANFTGSPDVSGHVNAPPTPAPSDTAVPMVENEQDAHLMELTDETWAALLSPKLSSLSPNAGLANGVLFKRGERWSDTLPSLGVSLHWTLQVKPCGTVDQGSVKQSEATLREVLRMYRNLALLTKALGLQHEKSSFVPLHLALARSGADGLNGMLSPA